MSGRLCVVGLDAYGPGMGDSDPLGAILAGGRSSRMGSNKALVEVAGRPMFEWVGEALELAGCEVVVAGSSVQLGNYESLPDPPAAGVGPIAGLRGVALRAGDRPVVLVATDQPLLRPPTVAALLTHEAPVVIPVADDIAQVTCAVYRPGDLGARLESAASLQELARHGSARTVPAAEWRAWGEDGRSWFSVDAPEAVAVAEAWLSGPA